MNSEEVYNETCNFSPTPEQVKVFDALSNWDISRNPLHIRLCAKSDFDETNPYIKEIIESGERII